MCGRQTPDEHDVRYQIPRSAGACRNRQRELATTRGEHESRHCHGAAEYGIGHNKDTIVIEIISHLLSNHG